MKKTTKVIPLALIIVALLSSMCGCNTENTNNHNDTKEEISSTVETDNTYIEEVDTSKLTFAKTCDNVDFYKDEQAQWYAYIESWNAYRKLGSIQWDVQDALLSGNTVEIIASDKNRSGTIMKVITMKLTRDREEIELNTNDFDVIRDDTDGYFFNYYKEGCAFFFYLPGIMDNGWYRLIKYETTDGGKTWVNQGYESDVSGLTLYSSPIIAKFITKEVGIVSYRCAADDGDLCNRTWFTTDCGKTWFRITQLSYPFELSVYRGTDVVDFKLVDGRYLLTVRVFDGKESIDHNIRYISDDLHSWTLVE